MDRWWSDELNTLPTHIKEQRTPDFVLSTSIFFLLEYVTMSTSLRYANELRAYVSIREEAPSPSAEP